MFFFQENDFCFVVISFVYFLLKQKTNKITNPQVCFCVRIDVYRNKIFFNIFTVAQYHKALKQLFKPQILVYRVIFVMKLLNDIHILYEEIDVFNLFAPQCNYFFFQSGYLEDAQSLTCRNYI